MIRSIEMKCFRKHVDTKIGFTHGLNVLRGPNEIGKTTITEAILYAGYGSAALVDKLDEVVTWGHKESELWARLIICIDNCDYVFTRSKAGAECNYHDGVEARKVTGQKEVTAFFSKLMGADAKTAGVLMMASQSGLRGALDDGPAAVSGLMSKLANFDLIDKLLDQANQTLALGSAAPIQAKLAEATTQVETATAELVDPSIIVQARARVAEVAEEIDVVEAAAGNLQEQVDKADDARIRANDNNTAYGVAQQTVTNLKATLATEQSRLAAAEADAAKKPDPAALAAMTAQLEQAKSFRAHVIAYQSFTNIPAYPEVAWDEPKASFDVAVAAAKEKKGAAWLNVREAEGSIRTLRSRIISGDGKCPTCGSIASNHEHVLESNAQINTEIKALEEKMEAWKTEIAEVEGELLIYDRIDNAAKNRQKFIAPLTPFLQIDESVYPSKVSWVGDVPSGAAPDVSAIQSRIATFEQEALKATRAEGSVIAHKAAISDQTAAVERAEKILSMMQLIDMAPLQDAYDAAYAAYSEQLSKVRTHRDSLAQLQVILSNYERQSQDAVNKLETAKGRVIEYTNDIRTLEFNNELVKRLKSMKPMITDHLWNSVLSAVSNFFSTLRGEQSIVTKDADGFKVNSRGGSLSGSTLDMLALAIRVALSKTFVPHANFMVLDEPAHGCDAARTGNLLGFLAGAGFNQTILASHDEVSEAVADNVIQLGA